ncbi:MAG TPA: PfkB family carbohydrate kinase [Spirochaetota bacterium]|nr:PfkB family carbohydrate kinase [Spirochaetota bacterium]
MNLLGMTVSCADIYVEQNIIKPGGNALNVLTCCAGMNQGKCAVIGAVGNDEYGDIIRNHYRTMGIDESRLHTLEGETASKRIHIDSKGDRYFMPDSWTNGVYGGFRLDENDWRFAERFDVWVTASLDPNYQDMIRRKGNGTKLAVDFLDTADTVLMEKSLSSISYLFASGDEKLAQKVREYTKSCAITGVVTFGAEGSAAFIGGERFDEPARFAANVVDTTGCGDSFIGAFLVTHEMTGDVRKALAAGSAAALKILDHFGGI